MGQTIVYADEVDLVHNHNLKIAIKGLANFKY